MRDDTPLILLIEEEPVLAEITEFRLELLGFEVETAASAEETFEKIAQRLPDAIILALELSDTDGIELCERLSNNQQTSLIPVMAVSSNADLDMVQRAYASGAKDYLVIPYDLTVLEEKLEKLLQQAGKAQ